MGANLIDCQKGFGGAEIFNLNEIEIPIFLTYKLTRRLQPVDPEKVEYRDMQ